MNTPRDGLDTASWNDLRESARRDWRRERYAVCIAMLALLTHFEYVLATSVISRGGFSFLILAGYPVLFALLVVYPFWGRTELCTDPHERQPA